MAQHGQCIKALKLLLLSQRSIDHVDATTLDARLRVGSLLLASVRRAAAAAGAGSSRLAWLPAGSCSAGLATVDSDDGCE